MNLHSLAKKKSLQVLGIMNGTSLDGVDFVFTRITQNAGKKSTSSQPHISYLNEKSFRFPKNLKQQLILAARHELKVNQLSLLHHELGRFYATCFRKLPASMRKANLIGLHGQTVFHQAPHATLQIGESSYLAAASGVPVIADFRVGDIALGGQGAPIATLFHQVAFARNEKISVHNLGGISNLSLISAKGVELAFDTGPANMLLDLCMQKISGGRKHFDRDGRLASQGEVHLDLVGQMLKHPYFKQRPPKSCGREEFGEVFMNKFWRISKGLSAADRMATLMEFTVWSIALSYHKYVKRIPALIIFCGGGAQNKYLLQRLRVHLSEAKIKTSEDLGWPVSSIEGAAFALLAAYRVWNKTSNLPRTTGAKRATVLGKITQV